MTSLEGWGSTIELHPRTTSAALRATAFHARHHGRMTGGSPANQQSDSGDIVVRKPTAGDAPRLAAINIDAWRAAYEGIVPAEYLAGLDQAAYEARWVERIGSAGDRVSLVADLDGRPAAYAVGGPYRTQQDAEPGEDTTGWGELIAIYADPASQGRGAGTAVHDAVLDALNTRGYT